MNTNSDQDQYLSDRGYSSDEDLMFQIDDLNGYSETESNKETYQSPVTVSNLPSPFEASAKQTELNNDSIRQPTPELVYQQGGFRYYNSLYPPINPRERQTAPSAFNTNNEVAVVDNPVKQQAQAVITNDYSKKNQRSMSLNTKARISRGSIGVSTEDRSKLNSIFARRSSAKPKDNVCQTGADDDYASDSDNSYSSPVVNAWVRTMSPLRNSGHKYKTENNEAEMFKIAAAFD